MTDALTPVDIDQTVALDWYRYSLGQGDVISQDVIPLVCKRQGRSYALVPRATDSARLATPQWGGVVAAGAGSRLGALAAVLKALAEKGAACVVLEDECREKRDRNASVGGLLPTAFIDEHVIHWAALTDGMEEAMGVLRRGTGGYPTNAFVSAASVDELGLVDGADVDRDIAKAVARSLIAVIVSAYDDETFMIWEPVGDLPGL